MTTGEKLKQLRKEFNWTQTQVLKQLEKKNTPISINTLSNAENNNGKGNNIFTLKLLADLYGVSLSYLTSAEVTNRTEKNMKVNKELGLSDKSIEIIKQIQIFENEESCWIDKGTFNYFIEEFDNLEFFLASLSIVKNCDKLKTILHQFELLDSLKKQLYIKEKREKILSRYCELLKELEEMQYFFYKRKNELQEFKNSFEELLREFKKTKQHKEKINTLINKITLQAFDESNYLYTISCTNTLRINHFLDDFINKTKGEKVIRKINKNEKIDDILSQYLENK